MQGLLKGEGGRLPAQSSHQGAFNGQGWPPIHNICPCARKRKKKKGNCVETVHNNFLFKPVKIKPENETCKF